MPMNIVVQEQRKLLGLTQEQVADYLGVSTPAGSKWEKGITSPDIGLLPPLSTGKVSSAVCNSMESRIIVTLRRSCSLCG